MSDPLVRIEYSERDYGARQYAHIARTEEGMDFYEIPERLLVAYEQARASEQAAEEAIAKFIADRGLKAQDGFTGWAP